MADAAQEFLDKQLSKNRFTAKQQARLDASGGPSVAGSSDGIVPGGDAYAKYGKMPSNSSSTTSSAGGGDKYRGFDADSDSGRNYSSGAWGKGELDAAGLAAKYNLDTSQEGRGDGHIWGRNADGSEVYIGKSSIDLASNDELIKNHSKQAGDEVKHSDIPEDLSSLGDIKGAILTEWKGGDNNAKATAEPERTPIEHSPEIKQATERVRAYEDNIMSGKTSKHLFGDYATGLDLNTAEPPSSQATPTEQASTRATENFLDNKKYETKLTYNFKPKTDLSYGAN